VGRNEKNLGGEREASVFGGGGKSLLPGREGKLFPVSR